ncbi:DUF4215 domain-containing protein [Nannocystaceae bacterium ST9]
MSCTTPGSGDEATTSDGNDDPSDTGEAACDNGQVESGEECDLGEQNGDDKPCTSQCTIARCGDGMVYAGFEACDDGNVSNADACVEGCELAVCGDGFTQDGVEECDDGNTDDADGCTQSCEPGTCGDGVIQEGEQCDDGNADTSDACPACQLAFCGDGYVQAGEEACDDGNELDDDACLPTFCEPAACGDGFVQAGVEECDDGNADDTDACLSGCSNAACGDGVVQAGVEECDDGNDVDDDFCANSCISLLYWAEGPQIDVSIDDLEGWEECFSNTYADAGGLSTLLAQQCTGSKLLMGCRMAGADNFTLLAMGDRPDVLFEVGNDLFATHEANGVAWYYNNDWSWGFALAGDLVFRDSCDIKDVNPQYRMCWHTNDDAITGGYRCGANVDVWGVDWERVIMQAD